MTMTSSNSNDDVSIWILFASQTGNSEQAARSIAKQLQSKNTTTTGGVAVKVSSCDDFLELERAPWSPIVVLCLSSYGVGQAPLGGYRFRDFCDYIIEKSSSSSEQQQPLLQGMHYALLGLGDSKYTTFFQNPTKTKTAMELAGAIPILPIGKADASSENQQEQIDAWIAQLWEPLEATIQQKNKLPSRERLLNMQQDTISICEAINPDFTPEAECSKTTTTTMMSSIPLSSLLMAVLAIVLGYYFSVLKQ